MKIWLFKKRLTLFVVLFSITSVSIVAFGGGTVLEPLGVSLSVSAKRTDNRDRIPDGYEIQCERVKKEKDTVLRIAPRISFDKRTSERFKYYFEYSPSFTYHDNPRHGGEKREWLHSAKGDIEFNIAPMTIFRLSDLYIWNGEKDWYYDHDHKTCRCMPETQKDDYYDNLLRPSIHTQLTADDTFALSGLWRIKRYEKDYAADRGDEDEYSLLAELMHKMNRNISYGLFVEYTAFDRTRDGKDADPFNTSGYPDIIDAGVQYITMGVQASYDFLGDGNYVLLGRTGYNYIWYEADELDSDGMMGDSRLELSLHQLERTNGRLGLKYGKEYADIFPYSSQKNLTLFGNIGRRFGKQGDLKLAADVEYRTRRYGRFDIDPDAFSYSYYKDKYEGKKLDRDSIWIRLSAQYDVTDNFVVSGFYSYEDMDSDVDSSYSENVVGISATYRFL